MRYIRIVLPVPASSPLPLSRLVVFMVCLSVAGAILAGATVVSQSPPGTVVLKTPRNDLTDTPCVHSCFRDYFLCDGEGRDRGLCDSTLNACNKRCVCSDCRDTCNNQYTVCRSQLKNPEDDLCYPDLDMCTAGCSC